MMACQREDMKGLPWFPLLVLEIDSGFELLFWVDLEARSLGPLNEAWSVVSRTGGPSGNLFPSPSWSFVVKNGNPLPALITLPFLVMKGEHHCQDNQSTKKIGTV